MAGPRSLWLQEALHAEDGVESQELLEATRADVCIVGGGYTGLWTALRIKELEPDADVVVIEQDICGGGPSGRNGGFALTWWSKIQTLIKRVGGRGGRSPRQGFRGRGQRDRRVLRARGCGRALPPGRLALDSDLAGAGRRLGVERGDGRRTRRSSLRNPERGGGAGAHRLSHPSRSGLREDRGDRAARPPGAWAAKGCRRERRPHLRAHADGRARPRGGSRAHAVGLHPGRRRRARPERLGDEDPRARAGDRRGLQRHGRDGADGGEAEGKRLDRGRGDLGLPPARPLLPPDEGRTRRLRPRRRAACLRRPRQLELRLQRAPDPRARGGAREARARGERRAGHACVGRPDRPHDGRVPDRRRAARTRPHRLRNGLLRKRGRTVAHDREDARLERASTRRRVGRLPGQLRRLRKVPARADPLRRRARRPPGRAAQGEPRGPRARASTRSRRRSPASPRKGSSAPGAEAWRKPSSRSSSSPPRPSSRPGWTSTARSPTASG